MTGMVAQWKHYDLSVSVFVTSLTNPASAGSWDLVKAVRVLSSSNTPLFEVTDPPFPVILDPRTAPPSLTATVSVTPPQTGSDVQLTVAINPAHAVPSNGALVIRIPSGFTVASQPINVNSSSGFQQPNVSVSTSVRDGFAVVMLFAGGPINASRTFMDAGTEVSVVLEMFQTEVAFPRAVIEPFVVRTTDVASVDPFVDIDAWDEAASWGDTSSGVRVIDQAAPLSVELTRVGRMVDLTSVTVGNPAAGSFTDMTVTFATQKEFAAGVGVETHIIIELEGAGVCTPDYQAASSAAIVQHTKVVNIEVEVAGATQTRAASSSVVDTFGMCNNLNAVDDCFSQCKPTGATNGVLGSTSDVIDILVTTNTPPATNIPSNSKIAVALSNVRMPLSLGSFSAKVTISNCDAYQIRFDSGTCVTYDSATVAVEPVVTSNVTSGSAFAMPRSREVSITTDYNIMFMSTAGLPNDGEIEIGFPEGIQFGTVTVSGAAITGRIRAATTASVNLRPPASSLPDDYNAMLLHALCPCGGGGA
eukprot:2879968-Rhodomonas_salina.1